MVVKATIPSTGGYGDDLLDGGLQADILEGGYGDDTLRGGRDTRTDDTLLGEDGNDLISGQQGDDVLYGGYGDDTLRGGAGSDTLFGGMGDDTLDVDNDGASAGTTAGDVVRMTGGEGDDVFFVNSVGIDATITDFGQGDDTINLNGFSLTFSAVSGQVTAEGDNLVITSASYKITLENYLLENAVSDLVASDFVF